jgi:hypothetical protein
MNEELTPRSELELDKLATSYGLKDLTSLLEEWDKIALRIHADSGQIILPNLFVCADPSLDFGDLADKFANYLVSRKLMVFNGKRTSYAYSLSYSTPDQDGENLSFPSFQGLYEIVEDQLSRYGEPYQGVLLIDISEWVERQACGEEKFLAFLSYMSDIDDATLAIFFSRSKSANKNADAYQAIYKTTRLKRLSLVPSRNEAGIELVKKELAKQGLSLAPEAEESLGKTIQSLIKLSLASTTRILKQLALDIAYEAFLTSSEKGRTLTLADIARFTPTGEWLKEYASGKKAAYGLVEDK